MSFKLFTKCHLCAHYLGQNRCNAFPKSIPTRVLIGITTHDKVLDGQVGDFVRIPITREEYKKKHLN